MPDSKGARDSVERPRRNRENLGTWPRFSRTRGIFQNSVSQTSLWICITGDLAKKQIVVYMGWGKAHESAVLRSSKVMLMGYLCRPHLDSFLFFNLWSSLWSNEVLLTGGPALILPTLRQKVKVRNANHKAQGLGTWSSAQDTWHWNYLEVFLSTSAWVPTCRDGWSAVGPWLSLIIKSS